MSEDLDPAPRVATASGSFVAAGAVVSAPLGCPVEGQGGVSIDRLFAIAAAELALRYNKTTPGAASSGPANQTYLHRADHAILGQDEPIGNRSIVPDGAAEDNQGGARCQYVAPEPFALPSFSDASHQPAKPAPVLREGDVAFPGAARGCGFHSAIRAGAGQSQVAAGDQVHLAKLKPVMGAWGSRLGPRLRSTCNPAPASCRQRLRAIGTTMAEIPDRLVLRRTAGRPLFSGSSCQQRLRE